jgi:hypothetical protein
MKRARAVDRLVRLVLVATLASASVIATPPAASALKCGVWRWPVKTLSDKRARRVDFDPVARRILRLRKLSPPTSLSSDTPRLGGVERQTIRVRAVLREATIEDDYDIHLVIAAPDHRRRTMIVEFPYVRCNGARRSIKKVEMRRARRRLLAACGTIPSSSFVRLRGKASITGVGFWDEIHGQTGVAPNGIELHPVLAFRGTCRRA